MRPLLTPLTSGNDNILDFGYLLIGGLLVYAGCRGNLNTFLIGTGCGIGSQASVDLGQNAGVVQGMEKVLSGVAGVSLVYGAGKSHFLTPAQTQAYLRQRAMGRHGRSGSKVMAGGNQGRTPISTVGSTMSPAWAMADCV
jgi:hypothetical protein